MSEGKKTPAGENAEVELRGMCFKEGPNKEIEPEDYNSFTLPKELQGNVSIKVSPGGNPNKAQEPEIG